MEETVVKIVVSHVEEEYDSVVLPGKEEGNVLVSIEVQSGFVLMGFLIHAKITIPFPPAPPVFPE